MANNEIKQKIVLDGEQQYKQALKDAQRNLKTLRTELKAETAELGNNATAQEKAATKTANLQKQIKEQEKVVKTYQAALDEVKQKYGDNADAVAKYEQQLNNARATLATMQNSLEEVDSTFKGMSTDAAAATVATKSVADTLSSLSDVGATVSGAIEGIFTGMVSTIRDAISEVWQDLMEIAAMSNNYTDLAAMFGTDTTKIQEWDLMLQSLGKDFTTFSSVMTKLSKGKKDTDLMEWLGIDMEAYDDQLEYTEEVLKRLKGKEMQMGKGEFDKKLAEIFKGDDQNVKWMLANWYDLMNQDNREKFQAENGGIGLSEKEISDMNELYIKVSSLKADWESLKKETAVQLFGTLALDLTSNAQGVLDALREYMNATTDEERNAALTKMTDNIEAAFKAIADAFDAGIKALEEVVKRLKESDNPTEQTIGNILGGLVDALKWLTEDNMSHVISALETLAAFWITGKGLQMAAKVASFVTNLKVLKTYNTGGGGGGGDTGTGGGGGGGGTGAARWGLFGGLKNLVASNGLSLLTPFAVLAGGTLPAIWANNADYARSAEKQQERLEAAGLLGNTDADFLTGAANALLLQGGANKDFAGVEGLLMGLGDRSDLQKMQLHNLLSGKATGGGNYAWDELQRLWGGEEFDDLRMDELLSAIADAYTEAAANGGLLNWWEKPGVGGNTGATDGADASSTATATERAIRSGMSGIKVYMDKVAVGHLVAPTVSEDIGDWVHPW